MYLARAGDHRRIEATKDEAGFCPRCKEQLVPKLGEIYAWHWSHKPGQACDYRKGTSTWEYEWLSHYHALEGWDVEVTEGDFEFDAVNKCQKQSLMLARKMDMMALRAFVKASKKLDLIPVIIFHAAIFENFHFNSNRFRAKQGSNQTWVFFYANTDVSKAKKERVSAWLDVKKGAKPDFSLEFGLYKLSYQTDHPQEVILDPVPQQKSTIKTSNHTAD